MQQQPQYGVPYPTQQYPPQLAPQQAPLPQGWEIRLDNAGRPYFIVHINKRSTYEDPRISLQRPIPQQNLAPPALPPGWELKLDNQGRPYFVDHINKRSTYEDPRLSLVPQVPMQPQFQAPQFQAPPQQFQVPPQQPQFQAPLQQQPQFQAPLQQQPQFQAPIQTPSPAPVPDATPQLPPGWEMKFDAAGRPYFIDHINKKSTYEDPRANSPKPPTATYPQLSTQMKQEIELKQQQRQTMMLQAQTKNVALEDKQPPSENLNYNSQQHAQGLQGIQTSASTVPQMQRSNSAPTSAEPLALPQGWEVRNDSAGRPYFIDHINKRSTYDDPRLQTGSSSQPSSPAPQINSQNAIRKTAPTQPQNPQQAPVQRPTPPPFSQPMQQPMPQSQPVQQPPPQQPVPQQPIVQQPPPQQVAPPAAVQTAPVENHLEEGIVKQGWISKQGGRIKTWSRRWFILQSDNTTLTYYDSIPSSITDKKSSSKGSIVLTKECSIEAKSDGQHGFTLSVPHERDYQLRADTYLEMSEWIESIRNVLGTIPAAAQPLPVFTTSKPLPKPKEKKKDVKNASRVFGIPLSEAMLQQREVNGLQVPQVIHATMQFLNKPEILTTEGLFRLSGSANTINEFKHSVDSGKELVIPANTDPHAVAGLLKLYLRELPEPVFNFDLYDAFMQYYKDLATVKTLIGQLPKDNRNLLRNILVLLAKVVENSAINKMTTANLAIIFGPTMLRSRDETMISAIEDSTVVNEFTRSLIENYGFLLGN